MAPVVRPATPADATGIAEAHVASWKECYRGQIPDEVLDNLDVDRRRRTWESILDGDQSGRGVFVADDGGEIAGFASVGPDEGEHAVEGAGQLEALYLRAAHWGTGVGRRLHEAAVKRLCESGYPLGTLWVLTANQRARRFYEAAGWRFEGYEKMYVTQGHEIPEMRYVNRFGSSEISIG